MGNTRGHHLGATGKTPSARAQRRRGRGGWGQHKYSNCNRLRDHTWERLQGASTVPPGHAGVAPASRPHPAVSFWGQLSGFSSTNIQYQITTWDADSNATVVTTYIDRSAKKVTEVTATAQSALNATNITINGLVQWETTATVAAPPRHYYDALGRETSVTSPLGLSSWQETRPLADALRLGTAALVCPAGV